MVDHCTWGKTLTLDARQGQIFLKRKRQVNRGHLGLMSLHIVFVLPRGVYNAFSNKSEITKLLLMLNAFTLVSIGYLKN